MLPVAVYVRLSKDPTGQQTATARQEADCRSYASAKGWHVGQVYEDVDLSAYRKVKRPAYEQMLWDVAGGHLGGVLVWKLDRLLRRSAEFERCWSVCEDAGAFLASVNDGFDTSHASGRAMARIAVVFATLEAETMSLRIKAERSEAANSGRRPPGGRRPFGHAPGWHEVVEVEAELVREAAVAVLNGQSLRSVVLDWGARGILTPTGGTWRAPGLRAVLLSDRVGGVRRHHGREVAEGTWPAILDVDTARKVRALLSDPSRRVHSAGRAWLLSGLLTCGRCGAPMKGSRTSSGSPRYGCPPKPDGCNGIAIAADALEADVVARMLAEVDRPTFASRVAERQAPDTGPLLAETETLRARLRAMAVRLANGWSDDEYDAATGVLRDRLSAVDAELGRSHVAAPAASLAGTGAALAVEWPGLGFDRRRSLVEAVVDRVTIGPGVRGRNTYAQDRVTVRYV